MEAGDRLRRAEQESYDRPMSRGVAILLLGGLSACSMLASFDGLEGRDEPAAGDAAPPPPDVPDAEGERDADADATADAARDAGDVDLPCGSRSLGEVFCDDFTGPLPSSRWTSSHLGGGGLLALLSESGEGTSPFLVATAPPLADGGVAPATAYLRKRFDVDARELIDLSLRLRADAVSPSTDATWAVVLEWPNGRLLSALLTTTGLNVQERVPEKETFDYISLVAGDVIPRARWVTLRMRVERAGSDKLDARALISVNGAPLGGPVPMARTSVALFPAALNAHVGIYYAETRGALQQIAVDDVRIEIR